MTWQSTSTVRNQATNWIIIDHDIIYYLAMNLFMKVILLKCGLSDIFLFGGEGWGPHAFFRSLAEREQENDNGPSLALAEPTVQEDKGECGLLEEAGKGLVIKDLEEGSRKP